MFQSNAEKVSRLLFTAEAVLVTIDSKGLVRMDGRKVRLSGQEKQLLLYLLENQGKICTKYMILRELYPSRITADQKIIDVIICRLRAKLGATAGAKIRSVWGRGYIFGTPIRQSVPIEVGFLPPPATRWTPARKVAVLEAIQKHDVAVGQVLDHYPDLSADELIQWRRSYLEYGHSGLCTTRDQDNLKIQYQMTN